MSLPAPVCTPHESCRRAAKLVRKHSKARVDDEKHHLLLHWPLREHGLVVKGRDYLKLLIKGSYVLPSSTQPPAKGKPRGKDAPSPPGKVVRFITCERAVYIQPTAGSMTAVLNKKERLHIDVHKAGDYAIELSDAGEGQSGGNGDEEGGEGSSNFYDSAVDVSDGYAAFHVMSLTLRFDLPALLTELAAVGASEASTGGKGGASGKGGKGDAAAPPPPASNAALRPDSVRNLDTGEIFHLSEVDERVSLGTQPSSLRPISRVFGRDKHFTAKPASPTGAGEGGIFSSFVTVMASAFGSDTLTRPVPLEPCLMPLPPIYIQGELLTGATLRVNASPDLFIVGDGLARARAAGIDKVVWRRHRSVADEGVILCTSKLSLSSRTMGRSASYTCTVDDAGCYLSATWQQTVRAVSGGFIQVHPNLRDAVQAATAAARASFATVLRTVHKRRRGELPPHAIGGRAAGRASTMDRGGGGGGSGGSEREGVLKLDGVARTIEMSWRNSVGLRRSVCKPLSSFTSARTVTSHEGADESQRGRLVELVLSARRSCVLRCASSFERDLLVLTLHAFLREWPPPGCPPVPLLTNGLVLELAIASTEAEKEREGRAPAGAQASGGHLIATQRQGLTKPLRGAVSVHDEIIAVPLKLLHADGIEYSWFRTARTGGRTLIVHAVGPSYVPSADDFGCNLMVVCLPYARNEPGTAAEGGKSLAGGGLPHGSSRLSRAMLANMNDDDDDDSHDEFSEDESVMSYPQGGPQGGRYGRGAASTRESHALLNPRESSRMSHMVGMRDEGGHGGAAHAKHTPADWLYGKPAHMRLPQEVRLPEALEWKLHRLCAKGSADFQIRLLPSADDEQKAAGLVDDSRRERSSIAVAAAAGAALTLTIGRASMHLRSGWNGPKRVQCEYTLGVGVSIDHWDHDVIALHLPPSAAAHEARERLPSLVKGGGVSSSSLGGGEATGGVTMRMEVVGGRESRDLLVLLLRYFVATACGKH